MAADRPLASNVNFVAGSTVANVVVSRLGAGGRVCVFVLSAAHLVVDVTGFYPAGSSFVSLVPGRLMDSRPGESTVDGLGAGGGLRAAGSVTELVVAGRGAVGNVVASDASAAVLNVTVTGASGDGYVTVWPCAAGAVAADRPLASNVNFGAGSTVANVVVSRLGAGGRVCVFVLSAAHLVVDVTGFEPATPPPPPTPVALSAAVSGLGTGRSLALRNGSGTPVQVTADGTVTLATGLLPGTAYSVTVATQPVGQTCSVTGGAGTVAQAAVTVPVTCVDTPGSLDWRFGPAGAGVVIHGNAAGGDGADLGQAVTFDDQGRIVVAGHSAGTAGTLDMALWRYTATGVLDTTFSTDGFLNDPGAGPGGNSETVGLAVTTDSQGRIVVAGYSIGTDNLWGVAVWRYLPDGTPDPDLNGGDFVRITAPRQGGGVGVVVDADDRIVVSGFTYDPDNGFNIDMTLWRFTEAGALDVTFDTDGIVYSASAAGGSGEDIAVGVTLDASDRIVVTGYSTNGDGNQDMALWRYLPTGAPDTSFAGDGSLTLDNPAAGGTKNDVGRDIVFDAAGRIVVTGWTPDASTGDDFALWRVSASGVPDPGFGTGGLVVEDGPSAAAGGTGTDEGRAVVIDAAGRIVAAGSSTNAAGDRDAVVWRYLPDGSPDTAFGAAGHAVFAGLTGAAAGNDGARDLAIDTAGAITVAGFSVNDAGNQDLALWRVVG